MAPEMQRKRKTWIAALALLIAGVLAVLWLGRSAWAPAHSPQMASVVQADKDRQRREAADAAARQTQAQEQEAAQDRQRREAAILQALQKQREADTAAKRQQAEADNLAAAERMLEQQRKFNSGIVQSSEHQAAALRRQEEERRLSDTVRALEQERIRTAGVVQASLKPQADSAKTIADVTPAAAPVGHQPASPVRVAATEAKVSPAAAPARKSGLRTGSAGRTKVARTSRVAHRAPALAEPCPLRWLDAVLTDMHRRLSARA